MGQWSELPLDLLKMIDEHVVLYVDKVRFRCVCMPWKSGLAKLPNLRQPQMPWLMIPYNRESGAMCGFYNPLEKKVYELDLPEAGEKVFKGTNHGWVVVAHENASIYVVNPLSRARVQLPPRYKFPDVIKYRPDKHENEFRFRRPLSKTPGWGDEGHDFDSIFVMNYQLERIVISSSPASGDFVAVAIYGEKWRLAYFVAVAIQSY